MTQHDSHVREYLFEAFHFAHIKAWRRWLCIRNAEAYRERCNEYQ